MFLKIFTLTAFVAFSWAQDAPADPSPVFFFPGGTKDLEVGTNNAEGQILSQFDVSEPFIFLKYYTITVRYPPAGTVATSTINYIKVTDKLRNGFNGTPTIISGGVGQTTVTIQIASILSRPVSFSILIKGA